MSHTHARTAFRLTGTLAPLFEGLVAIASQTGERSRRTAVATASGVGRTYAVIVALAMVAALLVAAPAGAQPRLERLAGADRFETAAAAGETFGTADAVVLATGERPADALAAAPLARSLGAPLLLTSSTSLAAAAAAQLDRLGGPGVWLVGGEAALSSDVAAAVAQRGTVAGRLSGPNRFATAAAIATQVGLSPDGEVIVVNGQDEAFADALSAGSFGVLGHTVPVLLTRGEDVPVETAAALAELAPTTIHLIGGTAVISQAVQAALEDAGAATLRHAGADRYATSAAVNEHLRSRVPALFGGEVERTLVTASGEDFPDGLAAGALTGSTRPGLLQLVPRDQLDAAGAVVTLLQQMAGEIDLVTLLGGPAAVSEA
ncbi:MAG TPA: cell wall-binding repeat-containing protein, partial [Euzebya sp.]|nr:cell wall-binding repeat-containing protein [Euzebya sp.]